MRCGRSQAPAGPTSARPRTHPAPGPTRPGGQIAISADAARLRAAGMQQVAGADLISLLSGAGALACGQIGAGPPDSIGLAGRPRELCHRPATSRRLSHAPAPGPLSRAAWVCLCGAGHTHLCARPPGRPLPRTPPPPPAAPLWRPARPQEPRRPWAPALVATISCAPPDANA